MTPRRKARLAAAVAGSAALHVALLAVLALQHSNLRAPPLPPPVFEVSIAPLYLVEPKAKKRERPASAPRTIRPRPARLPASASPVAPLFTPPSTGQSTGGPAAGVADHPAPNPPGSQAQLGQALRHGGVGCPSPDVVGLSRAERDRCLEQFGAGAKSAAFLGQGLSRDKQALLDQQNAAKQRYMKYRDAPMPPGLGGSDAAGGLTGLGDTAHGQDSSGHRF